MLLHRLLLVLISAWTSVSLAAGTGSKPPIIPSASFAAVPFMSGPLISPDGDRLVTRGNIDGKIMLSVLDLKNSGKKWPRILFDDKRELRWYRWMGANKIIYSIGFETLSDGSRYYLTRLIVLDITTGKSTAVGRGRQGANGDNVLYFAPDGSYLLLAVQRSIYDYPEVEKIMTDTNEISLVEKPSHEIQDWYADRQGVVRMGIAYTDFRYKIYYRRKAGDPLELTSTWKYDTNDSDIKRIEFFSSSDKVFVLTNAKTGKFGLYEFNPQAAEKIGDTIFENKDNDIDDFWFDDQGKTIEAVTYTDDRARIHWFDPMLRKQQAFIDKALPDRVNRVISSNADRTKHIVAASSPDLPGRFYVFDQSAGKLMNIANTYDMLEGTKLAPVKPVTYTARDGVVIPAYLTVPVGRAPANLPLIIMPHGGPFLRDTWDYDPWVQMLANRGYAVLQPNFRGSTGYGKDYLEKGYGQWGRAMQDDVIDGVKWAIDQKLVDPKRVCIMGASYGGYVAMVAATKTPDLFRCAISHAGVSDLKSMLKYDRRFFRSSSYKSWKKKVQGEEDADLTAVSPITNIKALSIPMLITHGTADSTVPFDQSENFVKAGQKLGKTIEWISFKNAKHSFSVTADHATFLAAVDQFLARYNPAD